MEEHTRAIKGLHEAIAGMVGMMQEMSDAMAKADEDDRQDAPADTGMQRTPIGKSNADDECPDCPPSIVLHGSTWTCATCEREGEVTPDMVPRR
jgi:hypothetical protein